MPFPAFDLFTTIIAFDTSGLFHGFYTLAIHDGADRKCKALFAPPPPAGAHGLARHRRCWGGPDEVSHLGSPQTIDLSASCTALLHTRAYDTILYKANLLFLFPA